VTVVPDPVRRSDRARLAILGATVELLAEVGYRRLSIEAIAARAGVGKQTIYRWWPSKGAVVFDALMAQQEEAGTDVPETDDLAADLRLLLRGTVAGMADPGVDATYRALTTEVQHDAPLARDMRERMLGPLLEATRQRIARGQASGQIDGAVDPAVVVELLYGPIFHRWLLRTAPLDDAYADALAAHVLRAVRPG